MNRTPRLRRARRGNILILSVFLMIALLAMVAFAVDVGYLYVTEAELQRTADSSAMAAAWELIDQDALTATDGTLTLDYNARLRAAQFAALNPVLKNQPALDNSDVQVGYIADPSNPASPQVIGSTNAPNSVYVRIRRTSGQNGQVPLFFARVLGYDSQSMQAEATAALLNSISGFQVPYDKTPLPILPFTLDYTTFYNYCHANYPLNSDNYSWTKQDGVTSGTGDGIHEINLFPLATDEGNRGTVDIGSPSNSTSDIVRQILTGISPTDMSYMPNQQLNLSGGTLQLQGDTGISGGTEAALIQIIGQPRVIPIFSGCQNPGNNCTYTICAWMGVRIMHVDLSGAESNKQLIIQPCNIVCKGGIAGSSGDPSNFVYSPVWLVR